MLYAGVTARLHFGVFFNEKILFTLENSAFLV